MFRNSFAVTARRLLSMFLLLLIPAQLLAACGETQSTSQHQTLVIWTEGTTQGHIADDPNGQGKYGNYLIKQFEKEHPGVTVKLEVHGWDDVLRQNLLTSEMAGTGPDIVVGENYFQQYAALGTLVPLDDVIGDIKGNLIPGTYKAAEYQGHVYGLSAFTGVFGFERNCQVVQEAGLDCNKPPTTWDELLQQSQTITQKGAGKYYGYTLQGPSAGYGLGSVFRLAVYLTQANAALCKDNCTNPSFNNPNAVPVYDFERNIYKTTPPGLAFNTDENQIYSQLFKGVSAYQIAGSWHVDWAKQSKCADCRYSPIPVIAGGKPASVIVGNVQYAVLKSSKNVALAKQWVKFLTRDDVQNLVYSSTTRLPSTRSALTKLRPSVDPATQQFIDILLNNPNLDILPQWNKNAQKIWSAYNDMLIQMLTTNTPTQQLMDQGQAAAEQAASS